MQPDTGLQVLLQHLHQAISGDPTAIASATQALQAVGGTEGASIGLLQIGLEQQLDFGVRQLALLVGARHYSIAHAIRTAACVRLVGCIRNHVVFVHAPPQRGAAHPLTTTSSQHAQQGAWSTRVLSIPWIFHRDFIEPNGCAGAAAAHPGALDDRGA